MRISFWKLTLAYFIDWLVATILSGVINFPLGLFLGTLGAATGADTAAVMAIVTFLSIVISLAVFVFYFAAMEHFFHASLGKMAVKLVVAPKMQ